MQRTLRRLDVEAACPFPDKELPKMKYPQLGLLALLVALGCNSGQAPETTSVPSTPESAATQVVTFSVPGMS